MKTIVTIPKFEKMRGFIFCISCCFLVSTWSQTSIIAHKSHSGSMETYFVDPSTNFGIPSYRYIRLDTLNDSTAVQIKADWMDMRLITIDTIQLIKHSNGTYSRGNNHRSGNKYFIHEQKDTIVINDSNREKVYQLMQEENQPKETPKPKKQSSLPWILVVSSIVLFITKKIVD